MALAIILKVAFVIALVAAVRAGDPDGPHWTAIALAAFGAANVLFSPPGTRWVRCVTAVAVLVALLWQHELFTLISLVLWLVWPPAFVVTWALANQTTGASEEAHDPLAVAGPRARVGLAALIVAVSLGAIAYRLLVRHRLDQTAALFIGIPALLAIMVVFAVSPRTATGVACKAVTIGLLISLLFLGEGVLCIVMSAPLFFLVAVIIGQLVERIRDRPRTPQTLFCSIALLALAPMSLEGVTAATSLRREEQITRERIVRAPADAVARAVLDLPRFDRSLPLYLRAGFPRPIGTRIEGHTDSMRLIVGFRGGETKLNGTEPRPGDLVLQLVESKPGFARWRAIADESHVTHFLSWRESIVSWEAVGPDSTRVTWTVRYRRGLDPAWYFGPWERYAVGLAAGYLIDSVATP